MKRCIAFLFAAITGISCGLFVAENYEVTTVSDETMEPTYLAGAHVLIDRMTWGGRSFDRGDVVLFDNVMYTETGEDALMMKRIIGLPGEWVSVSDGVVYIDNKPLDESAYLPENGNVLVEDMVKQFVDAGQYFVLGDYRSASTDSRSEIVGLVKEEDIQGKVIKQW